VTVEAELHSAEVYHDAARHFLDVQLTTLDSLSTKTTQYLSVASLALPVTFALLRTATDGSDPLPGEAIWSLLGALAAYLLVLVFASLAGRLSAVEYRPNIATVKAHSEVLTGIYLKQWVANEYEASIVENKPVLERKARWVGAEAIAFFVEGLCLALAAVTTLLL
jgi:hypothetical protein